MFTTTTWNTLWISLSQVRSFDKGWHSFHIHVAVVHSLVFMCSWYYVYVCILYAYSFMYIYNYVCMSVCPYMAGFNLDICPWGGKINNRRNLGRGHVWHGQERQPYYVVLYNIIEFNENLMICLVMVSYAWGGGATGIFGGHLRPCAPPGLNPVWASVCTYNGWHRLWSTTIIIYSIIRHIF